MANVKKLKINGTTYDVVDAGAQRTLTPGNGIDITNNVISATGGGSGDIPAAGYGLELRSNPTRYVVTTKSKINGASDNSYSLQITESIGTYVDEYRIIPDDNIYFSLTKGTKDTSDTDYQNKAYLNIDTDRITTRTYLSANHYTKTEVDTMVGDIESILQEINGTNS